MGETLLDLGVEGIREHGKSDNLIDDIMETSVDAVPVAEVVAFDATTGKFRHRWGE